VTSKRGELLVFGEKDLRDLSGVGKGDPLRKSWSSQKGEASISKVCPKGRGKEEESLGNFDAKIGSLFRDRLRVSPYSSKEMERKRIMKGADGKNLEGGLLPRFLPGGRAKKKN